MLYSESIETEYKDSIEFPILSEEQISQYSSMNELFYENALDWANFSTSILSESLTGGEILQEGFKERISSIVKWLKEQWSKFTAWITKVLKSLKGKADDDAKFIEQNREAIKKNISNAASVDLGEMFSWNTNVVEIDKVINVEGTDSEYMEMYNEILDIVSKGETVDNKTIKEKYSKKTSMASIYSKLLGGSFDEKDYAKEINDHLLLLFASATNSRTHKVSEFDIERIMDIYADSGKTVESFNSAANKNAKVLKNRIKNVEKLEAKYPAEKNKDGKDVSKDLAELVQELLKYTRNLMNAVNSTFNSCLVTSKKRQDAFKTILNRVKDYEGS